MNKQMVNIRFFHAIERKCGRIVFNTEVNESSIQELAMLIDMGFKYYQYDKIEIEINSPGGVVRAMYYLLDNFTKYKNSGKIIATTTSFDAASAAALILSSGSVGYRCANYNSSILYHYSRINIPKEQEVTYTYERAKSMTDSLNYSNNLLVNNLTNLAIDTLEFFKNNPDKERLVRKRIKNFFEEAKKQELIQTEDKDIKQVENDYVGDNKIEPLKKYIKNVYSNLLKLEKYLKPFEAINLLLIDKIGDRS